MPLYEGCLRKPVAASCHEGRYGASLVWNGKAAINSERWTWRSKHVPHSHIITLDFTCAVVSIFSEQMMCGRPSLLFGCSFAHCEDNCGLTVLSSIYRVLLLLCKSLAIIPLMQMKQTPLPVSLPLFCLLMHHYSVPRTRHELLRVFRTLLAYTALFYALFTAYTHGSTACKHARSLHTCTEARHASMPTLDRPLAYPPAHSNAGSDRIDVYRFSSPACTFWCALQKNCLYAQMVHCS